jgi:signal transduction histidine kinase
MNERNPDAPPARPSSSSTTTSRSLMHLMHDRGVRFAAGLAVVVAIPVAVLFYFQFRALDDLAETSAIVLRQLSRDTAESLAREIEERLRRPHIDLLLRPGQQSRLNPPDFAWLDTVFADGMTANPFIEELWVWTEGESGDGRLYVFDRQSLETHGHDADLDRRFHEARDRQAQIVPVARKLAAERRAIVAFPLTVDGRAKYVQLQLGFEGLNRERITRFVGFMVDAEELRTRFLPSLIQQRLATVQQPVGFPPLELYVADDAGRPITVTGQPPRSTTFVDERTFPLVFFDRELLEYAAPYEQRRETWRVRASFGPQTIPEIVSAHTRPQMALMIVLALGMGAGVFLVASAAAREVRLAELKSNFVAAVSHDLKTPLALIQLFAETLELGRVRNSERAQEYYRIINTEARKLTRLIENILNFSRMEAGLRPYRPAPADIGALTRQVLSEMGSQFNQAHFTVQVTVDPALPRVEVDEDAVEQAIENLLANAMKYSGECRAIDVHVGRTQRHVVVSVRDGGIGISKREQKKIFRKFYRVDSGLGGGPQGCGLGLAIVDHTMRGHGGFVQVDSEPGHGSTFALYFPIPAGADVAASAGGDGHETHSGDRGRTADVARSA